MLEQFGVTCLRSRPNILRCNGQMLKRGALTTEEEMQPKNLNTYKLNKGAALNLIELKTLLI